MMERIVSIVVMPVHRAMIFSFGCNLLESLTRHPRLFSTERRFHFFVCSQPNQQSRECNAACNDMYSMCVLRALSCAFADITPSARSFVLLSSISFDSTRIDSSHVRRWSVMQ